MSDKLQEIQDELQIAKDNKNSIECKINSLTRSFGMHFTKGNIQPECKLNSNTKSFTIDFSKNFDKTDKLFHEIHFNFAFNSNEIRIIPHILFQTYSKTIQNDKSKTIFSEFMSQLNSVQEITYAFDSTFVKSSITHIKSLIKRLNTAKQDIKTLEEEVIRAENVKTFSTIHKVMPFIEEFCLDSYLCKEFSIPFDEKPTKKEIKAVISYLIERSNVKGLGFSREFIVREQDGEEISIATCTVNFDKEKEKLYVTNFLNNGAHKITTKKGMNEMLSKQFYFDNSLMTKNKIKDNGLFLKCQKFTNYNYWQHNSNSGKYLISKFNKVFGQLALKNTIGNF
jgi:hypothetical protein